MNIVQKTKMVETPTIAYVAFDGTEFDSCYKCQCYEEEIRWKYLDEIKQYKSAEGFSNTTGDYTNDENSFYWFVPQSEKDVDKLNSFFPFSCDEVSYLEIGEVICIEESHSGDEAWFTYMKTGIDYVKRLFDNLGYDVTFTKREYED